MADYASYSDVETGSYDAVDPSKQAWIEQRLTQAENMLKVRVPRLQNIGATSLLDQQNAKAVIVDSVLRLMQNPRGLKTENVEGQGFSRFDNDRSAGTVHFTADELALFRQTGKKLIGNIRVAPPTYGQI